MIAMQKHQENETLFCLGALCVTGNEGEKSKVPVKDVSVSIYATFSTPCQWDLTFKPIRLSASPDRK